LTDPLKSSALPDLVIRRLFNSGVVDFFFIHQKVNQKVRLPGVQNSMVLSG
jgi:hypothetical protein